MAGWWEYAAAWAAFLLSHALPVRPPLRPRLDAWLGPRGFLTGYSLLSVAVLGWLIVAAGRAPVVVLWPEPPGAGWIVLAAVAAAAATIAFGLGRPNPLSFGGTSGAFDPDDPGPVGRLRHPVLAAVLMWSLAHLAVNGQLAHALLFGGFALFAAFGWRMLDRRRRRTMGAPAWEALVARMRAAPLRLGPRAGLRGALAAAAVAGLLLAHPWIAGPAVLHRFLP